MKIFDTLNPHITASSSGAVVRIQPNQQGDVFPPTALLAPGNAGGISHSTISLVPPNPLYVPEPRYATITLAGFVNTDTFVCYGKTFTCVTSGATAGQFNVGGTDTISATNAAAAINSWFLTQANMPLGVIFQPGSDDGSGALPTFSAVGATTAGAGTATITITGSNDGVNFDTTVLLTLALTTGTAPTTKIGTVAAKYSFYRAQCTALTGTGCNVQCYMKS